MFMQEEGRAALLHKSYKDAIAKAYPSILFDLDKFGMLACCLGVGLLTYWVVYLLVNDCLDKRFRNNSKSTNVSVKPKLRSPLKRVLLRYRPQAGNIHILTIQHLQQHSLVMYRRSMWASNVRITPKSVQGGALLICALRAIVLLHSYPLFNNLYASAYSPSIDHILQRPQLQRKQHLS